jgi:hypothetical protein
MVLFMNKSNIIEKEEVSGNLVQLFIYRAHKKIMMLWYNLINNVLNFLGNTGSFALRSFISAVLIQ